MVQDKFNMVDMGGIDIINSQGISVPGLYQKLVESITLCRYTSLYNWKFDGILIPPVPVELIVVDGVVKINNGIEVDENDVVRVKSLEIIIVPVITQLDASENGSYEAPSGVDGFNPVNIDVPIGAIVSDELPDSSIGENGQYYIAKDISSGYPNALAIEITIVGRDSDYNFTYWGARDIDIVFLDEQNEEVHLSSLPGANAYWSSGSNAFTLQNSVIDGNTSSYYEHSGLPGYWKFTGDFTGLRFKELRVYARSDSWHDFWRAFTLERWNIDRNPFGAPLISESNLVYTDWVSGGYTVFSAESPVDIEVKETFLYQKVNGEWVLIK